MPWTLLRRAPWRHAADRVWLGLVVMVFVLVSAAAASVPLVVESAQNESVRRVLAASEDAAALRQQPVVRVTGGFEAPLPGSQAREALDTVPGLAQPTVLGVSFGDELTSIGTPWRSVVAPAEGGAEPLDRRLAAVDDPVTALVPAGGSPTSPPPAGGVWLDEAAAAALSVAAGDTVAVTVSRGPATDRVLLPVAGVYVVAEDGPRPADVEGRTFWRDLTGRLPGGTGFGDAQPPLVTDVATLSGVSEELADQEVELVLWSVEAGLDPAVPTLRDMVSTSRALEDLPPRLRPLSDLAGPVGRFIVAGGVRDLQDLSTSIATTAVDRTRGVAWTALALAGLAVLVVAAVDDARRRQERRLEAALGLHPLHVGALRVLEVAPLAVLGGALGVAVAWTVVTVRGPGGATTRAGLVAAGQDGATAVVVALLLVGAVSALSAWSTARLTVASSPAGAPGAGRRVPWRAALLAGAAATVAGVLSGTGDTTGGGGGLEVVAPLLVAASCGALLAALLKALLRRRLDARAGAGRGLHAGEASLSPGRAGTVLALRRLAAPGDGQDAVVVLLCAGLAMAGFVALADRSLVASVGSKSAVLAGAGTVVELPSGEALALAPDAVPLPQVDNPFPYDQQQRPLDLDLVPAADVPVPPGDTVVWFDRAEVQGSQQVPVMVLDTDVAGSVLDFGEGSGALVEAQEALAVLAAEAGARAPGEGDDPPPPVLLVGERRGVAVGEVVEVRGTYSLIRVQVVGAVPLFPGQGAVRSMLVADTDTYLAALQLDDPRYRADVPGSPLTLRAEYWSARPAAEVAAHVRAAGLPVDEVRTAANRRLQPGFVAAELVQDYQLAVAALLVLVAVVGLAVRADRSTDAALPAAAVLRRTRLGRRGVRRALVLEQVGTVLVAVLGALLAVALLVPLAPALVDPAPRLAPRLDVPAWPLLLALLVVVVTALVPLLLAAGVTGLRLRRSREEVVLRDDR